MNEAERERELTVVAEIDPAAEFARIEAALATRWPESKLEPSLDRIADLVDLLGSPQTSYPVIHVTGTNGKTSTARMIEALLRSFGLRTGTFTSPHLESVRERICFDGEAISPARFVDTYVDIEPYLGLIDAKHAVPADSPRAASAPSSQIQPALPADSPRAASAPSSQIQPARPLSFFEVLTAMAYAAFAEAPVDVAIVEVGMGGTWDATNVADGQVAVLTPVAVDHAAYLGSTVESIAAEKAGIIKENAFAVLAQQPSAAAEILVARAGEVGASVAREGVEFGLRGRLPAVGGQLLAIQGFNGLYSELFLPLLGAHQAHNATLALAAVEAFLGGGRGMLDADIVRAGFADVRSPGRLETVRSSPTIVLDAAHNPAGAAATASAIAEDFAFDRLVGVIGVLADKDVQGILEAFEAVLTDVVITTVPGARGMDADALAAVAVEVFGGDRVEVTPRLDDALDAAVRLAESDGQRAGAGVLVTGSVILVGAARALLKGKQ